MPPRRDHKGGQHKRYEPTSIEDINAHPSVLFNFHEVGCLDFCQRIEEVKSFSPLTHLCALRFKDKHFQLADLDFKISPRYVSKATKIPYHGEKWFKQAHLDLEDYKPFIKPEHRETITDVFPFSYLLDSYAPLMKAIMRYFTCEGRFSQIFAYHVRLLMHFTRSKQLNLPYFLSKSIEKMAAAVQKKAPPQQISSLFHHSLIKIIFLHQLEKKGVSWESFISHADFATVPPAHVSPTQPVHRPVPLSSRPTPKKLKMTTGQPSKQGEGEGSEPQGEKEDDEQQQPDLEGQQQLDIIGQQLEVDEQHQI